MKVVKLSKPSYLWESLDRFCYKYNLKNDWRYDIPWNGAWYHFGYRSPIKLLELNNAKEVL